MTSAGPSGTNRDYVVRLAEALRAHDIEDPHVFDLERRVRDSKRGALDGRQVSHSLRDCH